jgi:hypothetical protein
LRELHVGLAPEIILLTKNPAIAAEGNCDLITVGGDLGDSAIAVFKFVMYDVADLETHWHTAPQKVGNAMTLAYPTH